MSFFAQSTAEVALGHAGSVSGREVARLSLHNAEASIACSTGVETCTLSGDADGVYHSGLFNDRLVAGLKGTMSEAELHILRAARRRLRNQAARGELRRGLPVGLVRGEADGEVGCDPGAARQAPPSAPVSSAVSNGRLGAQGLAAVSHRGLELSPAAQPGRPDSPDSACPCTAIHQILTNPVVAGAGSYGKTRGER